MMTGLARAPKNFVYAGAPSPTLSSAWSEMNKTSRNDEDRRARQGHRLRHPQQNRRQENTEHARTGHVQAGQLHEQAGHNARQRRNGAKTP